MPEIVMPRLSDAMEEGTVLRWLKTDGDDVRRGDELAEIETDNATLTYAADAAGVLEIVAGEGETPPVGAVIARLGEATDAAGGNGAVAAPAATVAERGTNKGDVAVQEPTRAQQLV